ncbi:Sfl1p RNJ42_01812 [Nakaseomyces bracarensis]|uniref:Sfl1p n=1 Tax=Nakaseomyces bracarensis TaxID=273131 RepID=UPI00387192DC
MMSEKDGNTVFIHKLYDLLENTELDELIWWNHDGESFLIRPNEAFSRNLAQYFKHTNITSFVRQLNIYGFHKISNDHFQNKDNEGEDAGKKGIKVWEFKHSNGLFKRGDLESLKLIKRRSTSKSIPSLTSESNTPAAVNEVKTKKNKKKKEKNKKKKEATRVYKSESTSITEGHSRKHPVVEDNKANIPNNSEQINGTNNNSNSNNNNNNNDNNNNNPNNNILDQALSMDFPSDNNSLMSQHLNQIKYTNLDMLSVVELISKLTRFNREILAIDNNSSPKLSEAVTRQFQMFEVQIASLRNSIMDRLNNSDAFKISLEPQKDPERVSLSSSFPSTQHLSNQYPHSQLYGPNDQVHSNKNVPFYPKHQGNSSTPMSVTPSSTFSNKNSQHTQIVGDYFGNVQHNSNGGNPFEKFQSDRHSVLNANSRRNMSVLVDPLTPASMISLPTTAKSSLTGATAFNQQSLMMYQQQQEQQNSYFSRSEPIITPLPSSHGFNPSRYSDPNLTLAQQQQHQQQQNIGVMKTRVSYPSRRAESPLKYATGPTTVKEEPNNDISKSKQENLSMELVGCAPSINSPMPVRPPYSRVYSSNSIQSSSLRNTSPPIGQHSSKDNVLILQRPNTVNPIEGGSDKALSLHANIQRNSTANPILTSYTNENSKKEFELTLPSNDTPIDAQGLAVKRNSSGVYSLLNTVSEKGSSDIFEGGNDTSEPIEKKQKI